MSIFEHHKKYLCDGCHCLYDTPLIEIDGKGYCQECTDPCESCLGTGNYYASFNDYRYRPCPNCNRTGRVLPNPIDQHPGYPTQDDFSDLDSPRLFSTMMKVVDPECYGIMRMETARWRALCGIEWEQRQIVKRRKALINKLFISRSEQVELHDLGMRLAELDAEHYLIVQEDSIEPSYNFKSLEG